MKKTILVFSALIITLLVLFQLSKYTGVSGNLNIEIIIGIFAVIFFFIGIYINKKGLYKNTTTSKEIDLEKVEALEISKREYEVLQQIASGLSNKEIGEKLCLSESTIKTHVSNLLVKLNAKGRTQAIQIAKDINIL